MSDLPTIIGIRKNRASAPERLKIDTKIDKAIISLKCPSLLYSADTATALHAQTLTNESQTNRKQIATDKNDKNDKNEKNIFFDVNRFFGSDFWEE